MAAGDFTNIRLESIFPTTVVIRYTYGNTNAIELHRSTDDVSYSAVQSIPAAYGSYPTIVDESAAADTLYYYKFTDDAGSTFTSAFTVHTQKQFPPRDPEPQNMDLPTFIVDEDVSADNVDLMRTQLEGFINSEKGGFNRNCQVCPVNGALVLDCRDGCYTFTIRQADIADINSISINCEKLEVVFDVPVGTETEICGWPANSGFSGDECFQNPVSGPVTQQIIISPPSPCQNERTRLTSSPCLADYIYECWDDDSLFRTSGLRNVPVEDCDCDPNEHDGINSESPSTYQQTMISGKQVGVSSLDHKGYAGFSLLYKSVNSNCSGTSSNYIYDYTIGGFNADSISWSTIGKPIFGFAINVPENVTVKDFTGHVLLFDFPNSRFLWGKYTNGNLSNGDLPTTIATMAMSTITPTKVELIIDGTVGDIYSLFDVVLENSGDTQTMPLTAIAPVSQPVGFGVIWVANHSTGNHAATLNVPLESALLWWD